MGRIRELDGLRAIAVLGVLATHFAPPYSRLGKVLGPGWSGVDLFFAISGFLITRILIGLRHKQGAFQTFYWRRTLRIFPPYYLALFLIIGLALLNREQINYREVIRQATFLSSVRPNLIQLAFHRLSFQMPTTVLAEVPHTKYSLLPFKDCLGIYWSLSVEELFYLIWAPIVLQASRRMVLLCSLAPLFLCPVLRGLAHTTPHIGESTGFVFRFDSLAAGSCVALLFWAVEHGRVARTACDSLLNLTILISSIGLFAVITICGVWHGVDVRTTWTFSVFGFSLLALMCASLVGLCARWSGQLGVLSYALRSRSAVYLGTVSYTMYLIHLPTLVVIQLAMVRVFGPDVTASSSASIVVCGALATACTIALAALSWKYVETPILRMKEKRFPAATNRSTPPVLEIAVP